MDTKPGLMERLRDGQVICAEGYLFELERRGYVSAGAYVPEVVLTHPEAVAGLHREFVRAGSDVVDAINRIGGQGKVFFAHFRNPRGKVPAFEEVFPDEGDIDMVAAVRAWKGVGFGGVIRIDHCPGVVGDTPSADRSFAFQVGYLRGLMQSLENM